jgi:hypothetical protein
LTEAAPPKFSRRLRLALAVLAGVVLVMALLLYAARKTIAREALTAWLRSKGVEASAEVHAIGPTGVTGSLIIGAPGRPDLTIERAEVGYGLRGFGLEVRSVRLKQPVLRAKLRGGKLTMGALDPLIAEFTKRPPRPSAVQPRVTVEDGVLLLDTDYGRVRIDGEGLTEDGRLRRLSARSGPTRLRSKDFDLTLGAAELRAQAVGDRVELSLDAPMLSASAGELSAANARLRASVAGPYPDLVRRRGEGAVVANVSLSGGRLALGDTALRNGFLSLAATGQGSGWIEDFAFKGRAVANLRAAGAEAAGGTAGDLKAAASVENLRWTRKGGDAVAGDLAASAELAQFAGEALQLAKVNAAAQGPVALDRGGADFDLTAHALGHGGWLGLGEPTSEDTRDIAAAKRAARGFRFAAPAVGLRSRNGALSGRLIQPVRLTPDAGGAVVLAPAGAGYRLTSAGGGLPVVDARINRLARTSDGATAAGRIKARLSIGPIEQGDFDATGALRLAGGALSFTADRCVAATARRLNFGENDARQFAGRLCPNGGPMLTLNGGDWRIAGRAEAVSAEVPFLQARIARGAGTMEMGMRRGALQAQVRIADAEASDAAPQLRFQPVRLSGDARLANDQWTGTVDVREALHGQRIATARLRHDAIRGRGGVDVDTGLLRFAEGGLQPAELSPLAAAIGSPAVGEARFTGGFAWTATTATSSGVLEVPRLDFVSPVGKVQGLSGKVELASLAPLRAARGQALRAELVTTPAGPITDLKLAFGLEPETLTVTGGEAAFASGLAKIEVLEIPLVPDRPIRGVIELVGVQLQDLVEASPFGERVELDAKVSGRVPFTVAEDKVRIRKGTLHAIQPGRLSIQRSALVGEVAASGGAKVSGAPGAAQAVAAAAEAQSTDTISDFAYQAMENLAFSELSAQLDSRDDGRLAVLFHIIGKHDPPQHQEIRLTLLDLIQKKFLNRKLPLPSGTGVNLTLDTTINLDQLLGDYAEFRRLQGSAPVQP